MNVTYDKSIQTVTTPRPAAMELFGGVEPEINKYPMPALELPIEMHAAEFAALPVSEFEMARRKKIHALQEALLSNVPGSEVGPAPVHLVVDGMYFRQLTIPAGMVVVSKRHAKQHICTISKGSATVFTEDGITRVIGPYSFVSPAGSKRVLLVHEEIVWATVHRTKFTEIADIEREVVMDETLLLRGSE